MTTGWIVTHTDGRVLHFSEHDGWKLEPVMGATTCELFTPREMAILRLIVEDKTNAEIAAELGKTVDTIRIQAHALLVKAGCRSRVALAVRAVREHWV